MRLWMGNVIGSQVKARSKSAMRVDLWVQPQEKRPWKRQKFTDAELVWQASQKFLEPVSCGVCRHQGSAAETGPETANCWGNPEVHPQKQFLITYLYLL